jgi:hypothetical protein
MTHCLRQLHLILLCLSTAAVATAQRATELYIPIGRSPGLSHKVTCLGTCTAVDAKERVATVRAGQSTWTVKLTTATRIYLDRSELGQPNTYGTLEDLRDNRQMEVKYKGDRKSGGECEWIKVRVTAPAQRARR